MVQTQLIKTKIAVNRVSTLCPLSYDLSVFVSVWLSFGKDRALLVDYHMSHRSFRRIYETHFVLNAVFNATGTIKMHSISWLVMITIGSDNRLSIFQLKLFQKWQMTFICLRSPVLFYWFHLSKKVENVGLRFALRNSHQIIDERNMMKKHTWRVYLFVRRKRAYNVTNMFTFQF